MMEKIPNAVFFVLVNRVFALKILVMGLQIVKQFLFDSSILKVHERKCWHFYE